METIAVYREAIVRIYGFIVTTGLAMLNFRVEVDARGAPGAAASIEGYRHLRFEVAVSLGTDNATYERLILSDVDQVAPMRSFIEKRFGKSAVQSLTVTTPVDLISFQGPHFGDRYGIAETAFRAVENADVPVLASGFSSSTVYMVFPGGTASRVKRCLAEVFTVPEGP